MASPFVSQRNGEPARRLANDHRAFEQTFFKLLGRARSGTWHELDEVWDRFAKDMEAHFAFEEAEIFPSFAERDERSSALVQRLREEHAAFRRSIAELGVQLQLHEVPTATVGKLVEQLREHAELENLSIYPWADEAARHAHRRSLDDR
jgi:hemerythrin superfamily protein